MKAVAIVLVAVITLIATGVHAQPNFPMKKQVVPDLYRSALLSGRDFTLVSLYAHTGHPGKSPSSQGTLHGWSIIGETPVKDANVRGELAQATLKAIPAQAPDARPRCFFPRHALRATVDGKTVEFVICFECVQVRVYVDKAFVGDFIIHRDPEERMNAVLRSSGIALSREFEGR